MNRIQQRFHNSIDEDLRARLSDGEQIQCTLDGLLDLKGARLVLTNRRVLHYSTAGLRGILRISEARLDSVTEAKYNAAKMGPDHHTLFVSSRQADMKIMAGNREAKDDAPSWPARIMDARAATNDAETASASAPDLVEQLGRLNQLHNSGVLSDAEFASAKAKLLA